MDDWEIKYIEEWIDPKTYPPSELYCRILLIDNSEMNVLAQFDGDWWNELLQIFIIPEKVIGYKYIDNGF